MEVSIDEGEIDYEDLEPDEYIPKLDANAAENRQRENLKAAANFAARKLAKMQAKVEGRRKEKSAYGSKGAFDYRPDQNAPSNLSDYVDLTPKEATYSSSYTPAPISMEPPEVILEGSKNPLTVTVRSKQIKNSESTPVAKVVKRLKKVQQPMVAAGEDRVRAISHDSFCSDMKREAIAKIAKYITQLPPKQQVVYEARLNNIANWRSTAKGGKAKTPKPFSKVDLKALMRLTFVLEKKALWYASVDLRRAARHSKTCAREFLKAKPRKRNPGKVTLNPEVRLRGSEAPAFTVEARSRSSAPVQRESIRI